jgi:CheY-like chemotaxis protein
VTAALQSEGCQGILLVEDDVDLLAVETQLLHDEGYKVTAARNGHEALTLLRASGQRLLPCLILLDLMMPVMDGWQFRAEQIRDPRLAAIPVVVMTAHGGALAKRLDLAAAAALTKPVTANQLLDTVQRFCDAAIRE